MLGSRSHLGHRSDGDPFGVAPVCTRDGAGWNMKFLTLGSYGQAFTNPGWRVDYSARLLVFPCSMGNFCEFLAWSFLSGSSETQ